MPSLNLDLDLEQHPKMRRLIRAVGDDAMLYVVRLWIYCAKFHTGNGRLDGYTDEDIHKAVQWTNSGVNLTDQLRICGFIRQSKKGYIIHDWCDHAGHLSALKKRAQSAAKARWKKYATSTPSSNAPSNPLTILTNPAKLSNPTTRSRKVVSPPTRKAGDRDTTQPTTISESIRKLIPKEMLQELEPDLVIQPESGP